MQANFLLTLGEYSIAHKVTTLRPSRSLTTKHAPPRATLTGSANKHWSRFRPTPTAGILGPSDTPRQRSTCRLAGLINALPLIERASNQLHRATSCADIFGKRMHQSNGGSMSVCPSGLGRPPRENNGSPSHYIFFKAPIRQRRHPGSRIGLTRSYPCAEVADDGLGDPGEPRPDTIKWYAIPYVRSPRGVRCRDEGRRRPTGAVIERE